MNEENYIKTKQIYESPDDAGKEGRFLQLVAVCTAIAALLVPVLSLISTIFNL